MFLAVGDNPQRDQWANYDLNPGNIAPAVFSAAHGCHIDQDANIYVSDWNRSGRLTKLMRVDAYSSASTVGLEPCIDRA
jgi:hypothetical protein